MSNTLMIGISQQMALRRQMDVIANNLANMNTTAFKAEGLVFQEYLKEIQTDGGATDVSYVLDIGVNRDMSIGKLLVTNNPLEFAIENEGYFVVETEQGLRYTRNGQFSLDEQGQLVTRDGFPVMDTDDRPIIINQTAEHIVVDQDGSIRIDGRAAQQIRVVDFENPKALLQEGSSLFSAEDQRPEDVLAPQIVQGALESSNVMPIVQMTKMIETQRAYQSTGRMIEGVEENKLAAIRTLGREA